MSIAEYEKVGGYQGLRKALAMAPQQVQEEVKQASLARARRRRIPGRHQVERRAHGGASAPSRLLYRQCR